jgi:broad specificity phosphatase PhoE
MLTKDKLVIIRHARSEANIRTSNDPDATLTEFGFRQARKVGTFLANHCDLWDFSLFTSPWLRCLLTAEEIQRKVCTRHNLMNFAVIPEAREYINHGWNEVELILRRHEFRSMNWERFSSHTKEKMVFKSEFNEELISRIRTLHELLPQRSLVVTHGLPALVLLSVAAYNANYIPLYDYSIDNASITLIDNGRVVWHGRNLHTEVDSDDFSEPKAYFTTDFVKG